MRGTKNLIAMRIIKLINVVLIVAPFVVCWYSVYASSIMSPFFRKGNWLLIALFAVIYAGIAHTYDGFRVQLSRISDMVYSQSLAAALTNGIIYIIIS